MTDWLFDTFIYTGMLIGAALVLRRPIGRLFGAQFAYALWALPLLRLLLPPIVLPASFAPAAERAAQALESEPAAFDPAMLTLGLAEPATSPMISWSTLALAVWLGGALAFLAWRIMTYRWMRQDLLDPARPVGEVGTIRLVETPKVSAPVAFGVLDKVVALPVLFMAQPDIAARDLAIAHELEHHRGRDLAANFAAQALLALHWFNPIAWFGWRAMRRDQEAACDARMLAGRGRAERARYAELIAGTAAGRHPFPFKGALAAPMACPVLGDASIIHRLRSLTMTDISPRRRWTGRALLGAAVLALPLTASFSYAANAQDAPVAPVPPLPPVPPAPLAAPVAPTAPIPPELTERRVERVIVRPGQRMRARPFALRRERTRTAPDGTRVEQRIVMRAPRDADGPQVRKFEFRGDPSDPEFRKKMDAFQADMEKWRKDFQARMPELRERRLAMAERLRTMPQVAENCDNDRPATETTLPDGRRQVIICHRAIRGQALDGLRRARDRVAGDSRLSEQVRRDVLEDLDREIEQQRGGGE